MRKILYEDLKEKQETLEYFIELGLIDYRVLRNMKIYEAYHKMTLDCVCCRYTKLSKEFNLSYDSIQKIILRMKKR